MATIRTIGIDTQDGAVVVGDERFAAADDWVTPVQRYLAGKPHAPRTVRPPFSRRSYLCWCDAVEKDDCHCWRPQQPGASEPQLRIHKPSTVGKSECMSFAALAAQRDEAESELLAIEARRAVNPLQRMLLAAKSRLLALRAAATGGRKEDEQPPGDLDRMSRQIIFAVEGEVLVLTPALWERLVTRSRELGRCLTHEETFAIARAGWPKPVSFGDARPGELEPFP